jgi:hypothetical protein
MDNKTLNYILVGVIIYLIIQQRKNKVLTNEELKRAEAIGMAKTIGDLGTTF